MNNTTFSSNLKKAFYLFLIAFFVSSYSFSQYDSKAFYGSATNSNTLNAVGTSQLVDFNAGAAVIDMGITAQTDNNALKPYGLVYELVSSGIPVHWIIRDGKSFEDASNKVDQIDITVTGTTTRLGNTSTGAKGLKAGPFLIAAEFIEDAYTIASRFQ